MVPMGPRKVHVEKIVGSVGHGVDFRWDWVPFFEEERDVQVLRSMKIRGFDSKESEASPISLVRYHDEYFVESDGHRRVSAARRLGLRIVEAEVYQLRPSP